MPLSRRNLKRRANFSPAVASMVGGCGARAYLPPDTPPELKRRRRRKKPKSARELAAAMSDLPSAVACNVPPRKRVKPRKTPKRRDEPPPWEEDEGDMLTWIGGLTEGEMRAIRAYAAAPERQVVLAIMEIIVQSSDTFVDTFADAH
jgi:hypothetical protein